MKHVLLYKMSLSQGISNYTTAFLLYSNISCLLLGGTLTSIFSDFLSHLRQEMMANNCFHRLARLEVAAEAGLCPVNVNQVVYRIKYINDWIKIYYHQWRTLCAQTFQFFALYSTLFPLLNIFSLVSFVLNFSFEIGTPMLSI